ncbi:MAG: hypothetical protein M1365_10735 [Actinobacteria bacterium]|nr:hypothetical protein [Actinomycetota bacterium]
MSELYSPKVVSYDCILGEKPGLFGAIRLGIVASSEEANPISRRVAVLVGTPEIVARLEGLSSLTSITCQEIARTIQLRRKIREEQEFSKLFGTPIKFIGDESHQNPLLCFEVTSESGFHKGDGQLIAGGLDSLKEAAESTRHRKHNKGYIEIGEYRVREDSARAYLDFPTPLHQVLDTEVANLGQAEEHITGTNIFIAELPLDPK